MNDILFEIIKTGGPTAVALVVLYLITKEFLNFMKNHLEHHTKVDEDLAQAVRELLNFLRWQNGNNKRK